MHHPLTSSYDLHLVMLSVVIATLASYTLLDLAGRVRAAHGKAQLIWFTGGAIAISTGIWSVQFMGMLAYQLTLLVKYDPEMMVISLVPAVLLSGLMLFVASLPTLGLVEWLGSSLLIGLGISAMHYTGMAAMQVPVATMHYDLKLEMVSVVAAIAVALATLATTFRWRQAKLAFGRWQKVGSAAVLGIALSSLHYLGMAGITILPHNQVLSNIPLPAENRNLLVVAVGLGTLIIVSLALLLSFFERRFLAQVVYAETLHASREYLQTILQGIRVGVVVIGAESEIRLNNQAALTLLGLTEKQLAQSWSSIGSGQNPSQAEEMHPVLAAIATQQTLNNAVIGIDHPNGQERNWLMVNVVPLQVAGGTVQQTICTFSDISDLKRAEEALRQSEAKNLAYIAKTRQLTETLQELKQTQARLVQQEKMTSLGQMIAGVAHEINNPVNFIYGNMGYAQQYIQDLVALLELYQQHCPNPAMAIQEKITEIDLEFVVDDLSRILSSMKIGADRIRQIVLSLRNFSRLDEAEQKLVDIHEGLDNTLLLLQHRLKSPVNQSIVRLVKEYGDLPLVECYAGQLNQVFMNILSNAIDALTKAWAEPREGLQASAAFAVPGTPPTIWVRTRVLPAESCIQIQIADNGPGIPEEVKNHIFDPFFTTKPVGKGTGLGLSISYQVVVDRHGGSLHCYSEPGQGTEFTIEIPIHQEEPPLEMPAQFPQKVLQRA